MTTKTAVVPSLGHSICESTKFLNRIHDDLWQLIESLDALMGKEGWTPPRTTEVTNGLGNGLGARLWAARSIWRVYRRIDEMKNGTVSRLAFCEFALAPETRDEAVCYCVSAIMKAPTSFDELWAAWDWTVPSPLDAVSFETGRVELDRRVLDKGFLPAAARAAAILVPIDALQSEEDLVQRLVPHLTSAL